LKATINFAQNPIQTPHLIGVSFLLTKYGSGDRMGVANFNFTFRRKVMKRLLALALALVMCLSFCACGNDENVTGEGRETVSCGEKVSKKHHQIITRATECLKDFWKEKYKEEVYDTSDGHFEIKNTRVITIKDNDIEHFQDVAYIIEYVLYTDYLGSGPYYENIGLNNNVVVYKNDTMEVKSDVIRRYRSTTYQTDFSSFIEDIDDYCCQYNCVEKLKMV
jgi:hypothetical protein